MKKDPKDWSDRYLWDNIGAYQAQLSRLRKEAESRSAQKQEAHEAVRKDVAERAWYAVYSQLQPFAVESTTTRMVWAADEQTAIKRHGYGGSNTKYRVYPVTDKTRMFYGEYSLDSHLVMKSEATLAAYQNKLAELREKFEGTVP